MQAINNQDTQTQLDFYQKISNIEVKLYQPGIESKFPSSDELQRFKLDRMQWSLFVRRVELNIASVIVTKLEENRQNFEAGIVAIEGEIQAINNTVTILNRLGEVLVVLGRIITFVV